MWASQYRNAATSTTEGKLWLAACRISYQAGGEEEHERICRAVVTIMERDNCCLFHALWIHRGSVGYCGCSHCEKARIW